MILSGSKDSIIRIWDPVEVSTLAGDQSFKTYSGYTDAVTALACQAKGKIAANLSVDGELHVWDLDEGISLYKNGMSGMFFNVIAILLAYPFGALVDRMHPLRVTLWTTALMLPFTFASYWVIHDYTSSFWLGIVKMPFGGLAGAASIPLMVVLMPKSKYGQMCSANALVRQSVGVIAGLLGAVLMDWLTTRSLETDNFRYGFLFQGAAGVLTLVTLVAVYYYWKQLGADKYVAPET
jgi:MFS family permease